VQVGECSHNFFTLTKGLYLKQVNASGLLHLPFKRVENGLRDCCCRHRDIVSEKKHLKSNIHRSLRVLAVSYIEDALQEAVGLGWPANPLSFLAASCKHQTLERWPAAFLHAYLQFNCSANVESSLLRNSALGCTHIQPQFGLKNDRFSAIGAERSDQAH